MHERAAVHSSGHIVAGETWFACCCCCCCCGCYQCYFQGRRCCLFCLPCVLSPTVRADTDLRPPSTHYLGSICIYRSLRPRVGMTLTMRVVVLVAKGKCWYYEEKRGPLAGHAPQNTCHPRRESSCWHCKDYACVCMYVYLFVCIHFHSRVRPELSKTRTKVYIYIWSRSIYGLWTRISRWTHRSSDSSDFWILGIVLRI